MRVMAPLGKETLELFEELVRVERIECGYRVEGCYEVCSTEKGLAGARHEAEIVRGFGYGPEALDGDELRAREPALGPATLGGVFYPEAASLDPGRFLGKLRGVLERRGVTVREGVAVAEVVERSGTVEGIRTADGENLGADAVLMATGPFSLPVTERFGVRIPVQPGKGYHRDVDIGPNGAPPLRIACVLHETSVFCTPMDTFVRFAGTMEFSGENSIMRAPRLAQLTRAARAAFPEMGSARPVSEWCGLRPVSMDGLPVVGAVPGVAGLHVATGHGMLGLTLAPVTGRIVADQLLKPRPDAGLPDVEAALSPARFA
jgi:D-amino-acid dehydrogenase